MSEESKLHARVLQSLETIRIPDCNEPQIERKGGRHDFPKAQQEPETQRRQRRHSLCYTDAIIKKHGQERLLIEVVDKNPSTPNAITGLTVNVDRVAETHKNIDLLFIALGAMTRFYCVRCKRGHELSSTEQHRCLVSHLRAEPDEIADRALIHAGSAASFKKALVDYKIARYLHNISAPTVVFLNRNQVAQEWSTYKSHAMTLVYSEIFRIISATHLPNAVAQSETRLVGIRELLPASYRSSSTQLV